MAVERSNPLPVGRYWVDVPAASRESFQEWLKVHREHTNVRATESNEELDWYLFDVTTPVPWEGPGFPSIAGDAVEDRDDTVDKPDPELDLADKLRGAEKSASKVFLYGIGLVGVGFLAKSVFGRK